MITAPSINVIKTTHNKLLKQIVVDIPTERHERAALIAEADNLIKNIELCSSQVTRAEDYSWLSSAAVQWQTVFSSILNIPKQVTIASPAQGIKLPGRSRVDDEEVDKWIKDIAYYFSIVRRAQALWHDVDEKLHEINEMLRKAEAGTTNSERESADDWKRATCYLAAEVIEGTVDLVHQLAPESYHRLESVWLKDVKELKAYFIWKNTRGSSDENYYQACEEIRDRLLYAPKGAVEDFRDVQNYINDHYLTNGAVKAEENSVASNLIRIKAKRIWETTKGRNSDIVNWEDAERYCKMFYENVIPAVVEKNVDKAERVLAAFSYSKAQEHRYLIINCFEAAIAMYYIDTQIIRNLLDKNVVTWGMIM